jgi:DNA-binding transcriptional ArsR family regulator
MGLSKSEAFTERDNRIARYAKALGHPARVAILRVLAEKRACMCGDIVELLPIAQSTVSQHLKELKDAGLIQGDIDGPRVCYCINDKEWKRAQEALGEFFVHVDACASGCFV